jgi:hypothetical protein
MFLNSGYFKAAKGGQSSMASALIAAAKTKKLAANSPGGAESTGADANPAAGRRSMIQALPGRTASVAVFSRAGPPPQTQGAAPQPPPPPPTAQGKAPAAQVGPPVFSQGQGQPNNTATVAPPGSAPAKAQAISVPARPGAPIPSAAPTEPEKKMALLNQAQKYKSIVDIFEMSYPNSRSHE